MRVTFFVTVASDFLSVGDENGRTLRKKTGDFPFFFPLLLRVLDDVLRDLLQAGGVSRHADLSENLVGRPSFRKRPKNIVVRGTSWASFRRRAGVYLSCAPGVWMGGGVKKKI